MWNSINTFFESIRILKWFGSVCDISALLISGYSLLLLKKIKKSVFDYRINERIWAMYDDITRFPIGKKLTKSGEKKVDTFLLYFDMYLISIIPFKDGNEKKMIKFIKNEIKGERDNETIQAHARTLKDSKLGVSKF